MAQPIEPLAILWDNLLSRQPERILAAYTSLGEQERAGILSHLKRMATEPNWHPEQRASALAALDALGGVQKLAARKSRRHK